MRNTFDIIVLEDRLSSSDHRMLVDLLRGLQGKNNLEIHYCTGPQDFMAKLDEFIEKGTDPIALIIDIMLPVNSLAMIGHPHVTTQAGTVAGLAIAQAELRRIDGPHLQVPIIFWSARKPGKEVQSYLESIRNGIRRQGPLYLIRKGDPGWEDELTGIIEGLTSS